MSRKYGLSFFIGWVLIIVGFICLITPFTPGAWLIPLGFILAFGKDRSNIILRKILGNKLFDVLKISKILEFFDIRHGNK